MDFPDAVLAAIDVQQHPRLHGAIGGGGHADCDGGGLERQRRIRKKCGFRLRCSFRFPFFVATGYILTHNPKQFSKKPRYFVWKLPGLTARSASEVEFGHGADSGVHPSAGDAYSRFFAVEFLDQHAEDIQRAGNFQKLRRVA